MKGAHKETMELCHEIEIIVVTKPKTETKKIIARYDHSIMTKNKENGRKILSLQSNLRSRKREEPLNVH